MRVTLKAEAYTSSALPQPELDERLKLAAELASQVNPRTARFFSLALAEHDPLKRFLYFFLALEVETHATFKRIDHAASTRTLLDGSGLQGQRAERLLRTQVESLKNLSDRFVWCATCVWDKLEQSDIDQFKQLKKVRDDIAHGNESKPPLGSALEAERLARKILSGAR